MLLHQTSSTHHALNPIDGHGSYPLTYHEWTINHYKSPSLVLKSKLLRIHRDTPIIWGPKKLEKAPHPMLSKVIFLHFRTSPYADDPLPQAPVGPGPPSPVLPPIHSAQGHCAHGASPDVRRKRVSWPKQPSLAVSTGGIPPRIAGWYWFIRESPIKKDDEPIWWLCLELFS